MSTVNIPLKLEGTNGDLKQMTSAEENYASYIVGKDNLCDSSNTISNITLTGSGNTSIGSFVNTFYNQSVGTHPASSITSGSTTTTLYQVAGTVQAKAGSTVPIGYMDDSNGVPSLYEMADSDLTVLGNRINSRIATSDYPGVYKLAQAGGLANHQTRIANVFSDTQTDGTTVNYSLYQKNTMSAPTTVRPMGYTGSSNMKEMLDSDIADVLGSKVRNLRAQAGEIGSYQLRSSSQGAPTDAGTWSAKGTATDTKKNTEETAYTRTRASNYARTRASTYSRTRETNFTRQRASTYTRDRVSAYTRTSTRTRTSNYAGDFVGNYSRQFVGNYSRDFIGDYTRSRESTYTRNRETNFTRDRVSAYNRTRVSSYSDTYTRQRASTYTRSRVSNYTRDSQRTSTRTRTSAYTRLRTSNYTRDSQRTSTRTRVSNYTRTRSSNYTRDSQRTSTRTRTSNYTRDRVSAYTRTSTRQFAGDYVGDYTRTRNSTYTRTSTRDYAGDFTGDFTGNYTRNYDRVRNSNYTRTSSRNYQGNYQRAYTRNSINLATYTGDFVATSTFTNVSGTYPNGPYIGFYSRNVNYTRTSIGGSGFTGNYSRTVTSAGYTAYSRIIFFELQPGEPETTTIYYTGFY